VRSPPVVDKRLVWSPAVVDSKEREETYPKLPRPTIVDWKRFAATAPVPRVVCT